jgi:hypothetical protein
MQDNVVLSVNVSVDLGEEQIESFLCHSAMQVLMISGGFIREMD